jgi:pseudouridine synthase
VSSPPHQPTARFKTLSNEENCLKNEAVFILFKVIIKLRMRLNQYIALHTGISRRSADRLIKEGRVTVNGQAPLIGHQVAEHDHIEVSGLKLTHKVKLVTIMLNKPAGYVCSRAGQGSKTIYSLIPEELHHLKPVGRLDKDSSGLLLMTNDGKLANELTHPLHQKRKVYEVGLDKPLAAEDKDKLEQGIVLDDGLSQLQLKRLGDDFKNWQVSMFEGRNRQIRRTFAALGYRVAILHRTQFGNYSLGGLASGKWKDTV